MLGAEASTFGSVDYIVFVVTILVSLGIGAYYGIKGSQTTEDFLMAGRSMSITPVALSLVATFISSISILGVVGEVYGHGITLLWSLVGNYIGIGLAMFVFMPIIYPLNLSSINEYLELRFKSELVKKCAMLQYVVTAMMYLGFCLYAPTLALESVTPISSPTYILMLGSVVTIYSAFGGLKAVVWTDAFQTGVIILGILLTTGTALYKAGGLGQMLEVASAHGRTANLDLSFGLFTRHTSINVVVKNMVAYMFTYSFTQSTLQRVVVLPDYRSVKIVLALTCFGISSLLFLLFLTGLSIFSVYANCDPIGLQLIERKDQMLSFYVMDQLGFMPGVPGVFVACLFSGTMSSISSILSALPSMLWADFFSHLAIFKNTTERCRTISNKFLTAFLGCVMMGLALLASKMGGLIQATATLHNMIAGPVIGMFLVGTCLPICGKKSVLAGLCVSMAFSGWIAIGMQVYKSDVPMLPLNTDQCRNATIIGTTVLNGTALHNMSTSMKMPEKNDIAPNYEDVPFIGLYSISYTYLGSIGTMLCVLVAFIVAIPTGRENLENVDPKFIIPILRKYCGKNVLKEAHNSKIEVISMLSHNSDRPFVKKHDPIIIQEENGIRKL